MTDKLGDVAVKTIAAFANHDGGTLLIGVDYEGNVLGLENDYASLDHGDKDKFELHLRNLLRKAFGNAFAASKVKIRFPQVQGEEICHVEIQKALEPLVLKVYDKNGQQSEKLYVRSGNASQEIPLSEMSTYIKQRFTN